MSPSLRLTSDKLYRVPLSDSPAEDQLVLQVVGVAVSLPPPTLAVDQGEQRNQEEQLAAHLTWSCSDILSCRLEIICWLTVGVS